jgi:hypothetical protein
MRVSLPSRVVTRPLDGELVLLNIDTEIYFGLDEVGARMWDALASSPTVEDAVARLAPDYDVEEEVLRKDLQHLIDQLLEHGLIELQVA